MSLFLDVRVSATGGPLAAQVATYEGTLISNYAPIRLDEMQAAIQGRHVLIATHGFNVNREDGIRSLANWNSLLSLGPNAAFIGLLWPGDSVWLHALSYPEEPRVADSAGDLIGPFVDASFGNAASISFASHSLGARVVLEAISKMQRRVRRCMLMAGAIDDDCLTNEYKAAAANIDQIAVLASTGDLVLAAAFPLGNIIGGILTQGHPWWHEALGRGGPASPPPPNFRAPFEIPSAWDYGHLNYLEVDSPPPAHVPVEDVPPQGSPEPAGGATGWHEAFSAAFASYRFL